MLIKHAIHTGTCKLLGNVCYILIFGSIVHRALQNTRNIFKKIRFTSTLQNEIDKKFQDLLKIDNISLMAVLRTKAELHLCWHR